MHDLRAEMLYKERRAPQQGVVVRVLHVRSAVWVLETVHVHQKMHDQPKQQLGKESSKGMCH